MEPKPANIQTSGDFFVGTTENLVPQATEQPPPASELRRSRRFMDCMTCVSSEEESRVPLTSCTGVNAHNMENKHIRRSDNPMKLPFELIKLITNNFSEELGRGAFGQVFKGVLEGGEEVAVKMLHFMGNINDKQFENEFEILKRLKHPNIVRLVGFCDDAEEELVKYKGKLIVCQRIHRALCLEYMPNGSLGKLLSGENLRMNWTIRYKIIKEICKGLKYLQEELEFPIFHLDLKPDNILLSQQLRPKISDFGLSRLIGEENTKKTLTPLGTIGYLPPEFINYQVISKEYDIYSLGVIITKIIVTGITDYSDVADMDAQEFIQHVHGKWKKYLQKTLMSASLGVQFCKQVKRCIEIARRCMENDRHKRPRIKDIVSQLDEDEIDYPVVVAECACPPRRGQIMLPMVKNMSGRNFDSDVLFYGTKSTKTSVDSLVKPTCTRQAPATNMHKDPPSEICHPTHPEHKLKLLTAAGVPFMCDGCKQPGDGPRYRCESCDGDGGSGHSLDLHTRCALADDPLFGLHTLVHPVLGYGKQFELRFLHETPSSHVQEEEDRRVCDACGEPTRRFVYHCLEEGLDIHPCCAALPDRIILDGRAFELHRRASRPCALCPENDGRRRWFWAYRCNLDDDEAVELHAACLKETARRSWEACYRNRPDVGDGAQMNVDHMLEDKFGETVGTVASFITALVFGNLFM